MQKMRGDEKLERTKVAPTFSTSQHFVLSLPLRLRTQVYDLLGTIPVVEGEASELIQEWMEYLKSKEDDDDDSYDFVN